MDHEDIFDEILKRQIHLINERLIHDLCYQINYMIKQLEESCESADSDFDLGKFAEEDFTRVLVSEILKRYLVLNKEENGCSGYCC